VKGRKTKDFSFKESYMKIYFLAYLDSITGKIKRGKGSESIEIKLLSQVYCSWEGKGHGRGTLRARSREEVSEGVGGRK